MGLTETAGSISSMNTADAFAMGQANRSKELMVFDWDKALRLIKGHAAREASAGLCDDWAWTGGIIWRDGAPVPRAETYVYLASTWATPQINIDGTVMDCYRMQGDTPSWNEDTYWPQFSEAQEKGNQ
jgi:hypothetical protein